jgi:hypothetical protein
MVVITFHSWILMLKASPVRKRALPVPFGVLYILPWQILRLTSLCQWELWNLVAAHQKEMFGNVHTSKYKIQLLHEANMRLKICDIKQDFSCKSFRYLSTCGSALLRNMCVVFSRYRTSGRSPTRKCGFIMKQTLLFKTYLPFWMENFRTWWEMSDLNHRCAIQIIWTT